MNNFYEYIILFSVSVIFLVLAFIMIPKIFSKITKTIILTSSVSIIVIISSFVFFLFYSNDKYNITFRKRGSVLNDVKVSEEENFHIRPGELEILSYHIAYPERISKPVYTNNNELGFYIDNKWFYWADGKILSENRIDKKSNFSPYLFFNYTQNMPALIEVNEKNSAIISNEYNKKIVSQRDNEFLDTLYGGFSERVLDKHIELVSVIGFRVRVHSFIKDKIIIASDEIKELAKTDKEVSDFLESLKTVSGYVWKNVSKSSSRSYHSYGVAIDTLPEKTGSKQVYWAWTRVNNKNWYATPYDKRWMPPKSVIEIFEKNGFIWGGKWQFFDTIHFEYRPEIIIYNYLINNKKEIKKYL